MFWLFILFAPQSDAATFLVTTTSDGADAFVGDGVCADAAGTCTLRAAVMEAEGWSGADVIHLPTGTFTLSTTGSGASAGDLDVSTDITVLGTPSTIVDASALADRIFDVTSTGSLTLRRLQLEGGSSSAGGCLRSHGTVSLMLSSISGCTSTGEGGAIYSSGVLDIADATTVTDSDAAMSGGGIYSSGELTMTAATVSANAATKGGGIALDDASAVFQLVLVDENEATGAGGGIVALGESDLEVHRSTVTGNIAEADGGGFFLAGTSTATIEQTTIGDNEAVDGAGIYVEQSAELTFMESSTLSLNDASGDGGGVYGDGDATLRHVTVVENFATNGAGVHGSGVDIKDSLFAVNVSSLIPLVITDCDATVTSSGTNVFSNPLSCPAAVGSDTDSTSAIGALVQAWQWYGLPTSGDAADGAAAGCVGEDQLGVTRPGTGCDIGAVEN